MALGWTRILGGIKEISKNLARAWFKNLLFTNILSLLDKQQCQPNNK